MTHAERDALIQQYAEGPALLRAAWQRVPAEARQWRPAPGRWSAHEVVVHCADSEAMSVGRIRRLLADPDPRIDGYDQDRWATVLDYHALPVEPALAAVEAVRANTVPLLARLTDDELARMGRHSESGPYGVADWLRTYGEHLHMHVRQIERNVAAFPRQRIGR
jgi:hypothetical protein